MSHLIDALNWRYATKQFDPEAKLSETEFDQLVDATRLSASSYGLQPYGFAIVRNPELRNKLREASYGQSQVTDASHLLVFAARTDLSHRHVDEYMRNALPNGVTCLPSNWEVLEKPSKAHLTPSEMKRQPGGQPSNCTLRLAFC